MFGALITVAPIPKIQAAQGNRLAARLDPGKSVLGDPMNSQDGC